MKKIALIGKPNVGKSSLFNRIAKERVAITDDTSGTTRDIRERKVEINERPCIIVDTGGLDDSSILFEAVKEKSLKAAKEADLILYIVDGKYMPDDEDKKIFFELQKLGKELALIINKIDNEKMSEREWEFMSFGAKNQFLISVSHNRGINRLLEWVSRFIPKESEELILIEDEGDISLEDYIVEQDSNDVESKEIKVAIIGRVNVGKSSLLNALLGEERSVVSEVAGTTIDPVDDYMTYKDKVITFVDTAGIRRRGKIEGIEKHALHRTQGMLENADIALLVLDASEELKELDEKIAGLIDKFQLGCIIVLNKWDKSYKSFEESIQAVRDRFKFLSYAPIMTVSALSKKRVHKINDKILEVFSNYSKRVSTSKLNEMIKIANSKHHIPSDQGKLVKIYFATQFETKPPRIALIMNRPKSLHFTYKRYLINQLRDYFGFSGSPIILIARKRGENEKERD